MKSQKNLFFSKKETEDGENVLKKMFPNYNKNKKLVCIHCRDSFYHAYKDINIFPKHKNWKDRFRNVDINNFIKGIYLANTQEYNVIRVGNFHEKKFELDKKKFNFFDYSFSEYKSDFMDLFLAYKADLYLGSDSGLVMFPGLFRKKMMMHNIISVTTLKDFDDFTCSLVNFKKIYSKILGRFITFSENYKLNILNFQDDDFFSNKLEVIESSEDEIENFIQECIWIKEDKNNSYFNCDLQNKARNLMRQFHISDMNNIRISPYFLKKYSKLIK
jgi:putative glycosyltransferase (TIGR04372 family)